MDLVTGGGGFIGSHLVDRLVADGRSVRVVDNFVVGSRRNLLQHDGNPGVEIFETDIRDGEALEPVFAGTERVFHLAARADIVPSIVEPKEYFTTNVDGTFNVLEASKRAGVSRITYVASSTCYGIPDSYPTPEDAPIRPQFPYALTKHMGEELVLHWGRTYDLPANVLRFFNVYGPRARTSGTYGAVFRVFLAQMLADQLLTIVGDGEQTRDFTFVSDVVDALVTTASSDLRDQVLNVGSGAPVSVNRLVELLQAKDSINIPKRPGEPDCTFADMTKIREALGWSPKVGIEEGVAIYRVLAGCAGMDSRQDRRGHRRIVQIPRQVVGRRRRPCGK